MIRLKVPSIADKRCTLSMYISDLIPMIATKCDLQESASSDVTLDQQPRGKRMHISRPRQQIKRKQDAADN